MTPIIISHAHARGYAFAIVKDTGEQVFIPPHVFDGSGLQTGSDAFAVTAINPNEEQRALTKLVAVKVQPMQATMQEPEEVGEAEASSHDAKPSVSDLDATTYDLICEGQYMTTAELAEHLDVDTKTAGNSAYRLYNSGKIAKADVYARVGQSRPSFILWAKNAADFLEG